MPTWPWRKQRLGMDEYGRTPLWYQAMNGDTPAIRKSLVAGIDPTSADKGGFSALHVAAEYGHGEAISLLIEAGADVNCVDRHGNGPLWVAARCARAPNYDTRVVAALLAAGADFNHANAVGKTPPGWAAGIPAVESIFRSAGYEGEFDL